MKVSKKSVNGGSQVSGGFIFDQMDRFAHDKIKREYNIKDYLFTKDARIEFVRQICDFNDCKLSLVTTATQGENTFYARVVIVDKDEPNTIYATCFFSFVRKETAFCKTNK